MAPVFIFEWCHPWGFERAWGAERVASPARGSRNPRPLGSPASRSNRGEKHDARECVSSEPRRKGRPTLGRSALPGVPRKERPEGQSHGGAAPLPDKERSLGYPATNSPRGKAQAGKSPLRHHEKTKGYGVSPVALFSCHPSFIPALLPVDPLDHSGSISIGCR